MKNVPENISVLKFLEQDYSTEDLNSSLLNDIDACVFIVDVQQLKPIWLNDYFFERLRYDRDFFHHLTSEKFFGLFHPKSLAHYKQRLESFDRTGNPGLKSIYQVRTADDEWVYMMVSSRAFRSNPDGSTKYLLGFATVINKSEFARHIKRIREYDGKTSESALTKKLSKRELSVIKLITSGFTDKEIADNLHISIHTTKTHRKRIISKLGLKNTAALVKFAVENGLD